VPLATTDESVPASLTLADLDGDGYPDVVLGTNLIGAVRGGMNDGSGTMRPAARDLPDLGSRLDARTTGLTGVAQQAFADLNNDGQADFITTSLGGLDVYLAQGEGTFKHVANLPNPFPASPLSWVQVGDLNNDGIPDVVCGTTGNYGQGLAVYLGNGDGTFRQAPTFTYQPANYAIANATLVDVNHDGKLDVVATLAELAQFTWVVTSFGVFFGDGKGNLQFNLNTIVPVYGGGSDSYAPTPGDFNKDGRPDLLVQTNNAASPFFRLTDYVGNGNGTFTPGPIVNSGADAPVVQVLVADVDGDGASDAISYNSPNSGSGTATVFLGDGHGGFRLASTVDVTLPSLNGALAAVDLAVGDFNGDGKLDLAASFYSADTTISSPDQIAIYLGDGTGHFAAPQFVTVGSNPFTLVSIPRAPFLDAGTFAVTDHAPVATNGQATVASGSAVVIPILSNTSDPDHEPLRITKLGDPANGVVHVNNNGTPNDPTDDTFVYAPVSGFTGTDSFTYTVADAAGVEATATVAVTVTPAPPPPQVAFSAAAYSVAENAGSITLTVTRTGASTGTLTVHYATSDGTATAGTNYIAASDALTFGPGETSKTFTIYISDDGVADGDKTLRVTLSGTVGGSLGSPATAVVTITNTDGTSGGGGQVQFAAASYSVGENGSAVTITVTRTGDATGSLTVQYATSDGTAQAGVNYMAAADTLTFGPGETSKTFTISVSDDGVADGDKTVQLTLSGATGGTLGSPATAVLTIADTDTPGVPNGPPSPKLIDAARAFAHSKEHYTQFVVGAYQQYLKRTPDPVGLDFWVQNMQAGVYTDEQVEAFFIGSQEYIASHGGTGQAWVTGMYKDLLGRDPQPDEVDRWVAALNGGTPPDAVAHGFAASPERESQRVRFNYNTYLGRPAQQAEVDEWVNAFVGGITNEDMVAGFVGSPEYYQNPNKGQGNEARWVAQAYLDVLFRAAGAGEIDFWVRFLDS
jgi:hypothetical protein